MNAALLFQIVPQFEPSSFFTDIPSLFEKGAVALLIGALVGLERERSLQDRKQLFAGIRTFPLIALLGLLAALIGSITGMWSFIAFAVGFMALIIVAYVFSARQGFPGMTSEVAAMIVFILGAFTFWEMYLVAIAGSVILALFLSLKAPLHSFISKVHEEDIYATLKFAIITAIILPVLPDRTMGPFDVLNPRQIWYMVILIAGVSFLGYILVKIMGPGKGISLTGLVGGMASSTAVTLSLSQKSKEAPDLGRLFAAAIVLACTVLYPRVAIEIAIINGDLLRAMWPYLLALAGVGVLLSLILLRGTREESGDAVKLENPFRLTTALWFGVIFAAILFLSKAAQEYLGDSGVFIAAALSGVTQVDAITLSMASLSKTSVPQATAISAILIAVAVNTVMKSVMVLFFASPSLRRFVLPALISLFLATLLVAGVVHG